VLTVGTQGRQRRRGGTVSQKRGLGLASRSRRRLPCGVVDGDERRVSDCLGGAANDNGDVQAMGPRGKRSGD
jgi:hypothetical protein